MRQKIVLGKQPVSLRVNLPNGTSFVARYEKISRKTLPGNISVSRTRTIGPRKKRRFALANTPTQDRARRIKRKYRKLRRAQTGKGPAGNLANLGISISSKDKF